MLHDKGKDMMKQPITKDSIAKEGQLHVICSVLLSKCLIKVHIISLRYYFTIDLKTYSKIIKNSFKIINIY